MILSTPGLVLHTTPYSESSVVAKVFTRQLGMRSYIIKGVRGPCGRVKQNLLQPLSSLDMVVYNNPKADLNYVKELSPRHPDRFSEPVDNALRFFMTEVLYKALREEEPLPALFDYVDATFNSNKSPRDLPITFLLTVARHLGIEPLNNYSSREPFFDLQEGRFVSSPTETTLLPNLSALLYQYLLFFHSLSLPVTPCHSPLEERTALINALLNYYQLHLSGFSHFHSHEILHTILI
ncbi:MAG: DNA repair protein RecO [bacterium]